jgi:hypothetical protein
MAMVSSSKPMKLYLVTKMVCLHDNAGGAGVAVLLPMLLLIVMTLRSTRNFLVLKSPLDDHET